MAGRRYRPPRVMVVQVPCETYTGIPLREAPEPLASLLWSSRRVRRSFRDDAHGRLAC